jgi:hypothetical protein
VSSRKKGYKLTHPATSFDAVKHCLDHAPKDLTLAQRLVLIQIAHHYPNPWLEQKSIAAEIGIRRIDTVYKAIKVLEKRKLLVVFRQGMMKANKYRLHDDFADTAETGSVTTRQTVNHDTRQTAIKQTNIKKENKAFFDFLSNFPNSTISEQVVAKAWSRALLKNASEDLLVAASRTNREMLEPDAWLNFEKWKGFKTEVDEIALIRESSK